MPSESFKEFEKNLTDVKRLVSLHNTLSRPNGTGGRGKRGLGHLTRAGIVLLCAAWERYVESVLEEGAGFLASKHTLDTLPASTKKLVQDFVNGGKSGFSAATLPANLKPVMVEAVRYKTVGSPSANVFGLNTPKHKQLKPLFDSILCVTDIGNHWSKKTKPIDDFVSARGEVAHRGGQAKYVHFAVLTKAVVLVSDYVIETDNFLSDHLRGLVMPKQRPWNRQNS